MGPALAPVVTSRHWPVFGPESVVTSWPVLRASGRRVGGHPMAGFASGRGADPSRPAVGRRCRRPSGIRRPFPAGRRLLLSIRRNDQPSWPSAMTCFFFSSFKTLLTLTEGNPPLIQCPERFLLAGFQVTTLGRFWVTAEGELVLNPWPTTNCDIKFATPRTEANRFVQLPWLLTRMDEK